LDTQHHPAAVPLPSSTGPNRGGGGSTHGPTRQQPPAAQEMRVPPSPAPSSTSSLSLYSSESAKKSVPNVENQDQQQRQQQEEEDKRKGSFCMCFTLFGTKPKPNKVLAPREPSTTAEPAPAPQMVQSRRRPPSLVIIR
jgi:hypothetical protein